MNDLRELAGALLTEGSVDVVIGWEGGPNGARPAFITRPEDASRLIFDARCVHNLAAYLSPRRAHVRRLGRPAVVVKPCDVKAVAVLLRESQIRREDFVLIGTRCGGVLATPDTLEPLTADNVSDRCPTCEAREPEHCDHVVGEAQPPPPGECRRDAMLDRLEAMTPAERWAFWQAEFQRCVRCDACRMVCPLCVCERCVTEKSRPQWIEPSAHPTGVLAWQMTRAQHHAGRCSDCGECARVCPAGIPLDLLNREVARIVLRRFDYRGTADPSVPGLIGVFRADDDQEFIR